MSSSTAINTLDKTANEVVTFGMPFSGKMAAGDSILNAGNVTQTIATSLGVDTGVVSTDLSFSSPTITVNMPGANPPGPGISVRITGGVSGVFYMLHFKGVVTNLGEKLENEGLLSVKF